MTRTLPDGSMVPALVQDLILETGFVRAACGRQHARHREQGLDQLLAFKRNPDAFVAEARGVLCAHEVRAKMEMITVGTWHVRDHDMARLAAGILVRSSDPFDLRQRLEQC